MNDSFENFGIKEIAKKANVSIATVDRVIHNRTGVAKKTRDKILAIIEEHNYQPNIFARRLASRKLIRFASLMPALSEETSFWVAPLNGIIEAENEIAQYGIKVDKFFYDQNSTASFNHNAELILEGDYDGLLVAPLFIGESQEFAKKCEAQKLPYVFFNSDIPDNKSLAYIGPDLFQSGCLAAHLMRYLVKSDDSILVINISREMSNHHHVLRKEEGFRAYLSKNGLNNKVFKKDIRKTDYPSIRNALSETLSSDISAIFVTNSRVSYVARYLEEVNRKDILLIGFDLLEQNLYYLKNNTIDFLICHKPKEQAYRGIMQLYNSLVHFSESEKIQFMPIDIITRENYQFYKN